MASLQLRDQVRRNTRFHSQSRAGFTLINTIALILAISALMSFSVIVLRRAYTTHSQALQHLNLERKLRIIADRFRDDAHKSHHVEIGESLSLVRNKHKVVYSVDGSQLSRVLLFETQEVVSESWTLPSELSAKWETDDSGALELVTWRLEFAAGEGSMTKLSPVEWLARVGVFRSKFQDSDSADASKESK